MGERSDDGSAVVEFVLVSVLIIAIVAGVIQLALTLHLRNMLTSCAADGAQLAARHDRVASDGQRRTEHLIAESTDSRGVRVEAREVTVDGVVLDEVTVSAPVPVLGLWGAVSMTVTAHALEEVNRG